MRLLIQRTLLFTILFMAGCAVSAQGYDQERIQLAKFIERMYHNTPFEGCRIIDDYDNSYILSVVSLDSSKYKTFQIMNRVAEVKSQRNAGEFINGTRSYTEMTIKTAKGEEDSSKMKDVYELIRTNSVGYIRQMALLITFKDITGKQVFVYYTKIN